MKKKNASKRKASKKQAVTTKWNNQDSNRRLNLQFIGSLLFSYLLTVYQDNITELHHRVIADVFDFFCWLLNWF